MKFFVFFVSATICNIIVTPVAAQCNEFENLLAYDDVFIVESARDKFGNVYVVGNFRNENFIIGTTHIPVHGTMSYFLVKFDKNFNLLWATSGGKYAFGNAVELDSQGNVVIAGTFYEQISFDCIQLSAKGDADLFVAKYNQFGHALWATASEGESREIHTDLSLSPQDNIIVSGFYHPAANMGFGNVKLPISKGVDGFMVCISPAGDALWGTAIGTSMADDFPDYIHDTTVDSEGNIIITGMFESVQLHIGNFTLNRSTFAWNYYLAKFNAAGQVLWVRDTPGPDDSGEGVVTDSNNNIFVTGRFMPGTYSIGGIPLSSKGDADVFVAKYSPDGNVIGAVSFGGDRWEQPQGFCVMPNDNIAIAGHFYSLNFPIGPFTLTKPEFEADMFMVLMDNDLTPLCVKRSSGAGNDWVVSLNADIANNLMMTINGAPTQFDGKFTFNKSPSYGFIMIGNEQNFQNNPSANTLFDFNLGDDVVKCLSDEYELKAPTLCNATYAWSDGSVGTAIDVVMPGQYWVSVTINGTTARDTILVLNKENPTVNLGNDVAICEGDVVSFDVTQNTPSQYLWDDGSTLPTRTVSAIGNYWVRVTGQCAEVSDDVNVMIPQSVAFDFGDDQQLCYGETVVLTSGVVGVVDHLWQDGSTAAEFLVEDTGEYILTVSSGCKNHTDTINIKRLFVDHLKIPNIVTANPEADEFNNTFLLPDELAGARVTILNRYGAVVFFSNNYKNTWPESEQTSGVYYYHIMMDCFDKPLKGSLQLLR